MKQTYTMEEAAVYLGMRERTIYNYRKRGVLKLAGADKNALTAESVEQLKKALDVVNGRTEKAAA